MDKQHLRRNIPSLLPDQHRQNQPPMAVAAPGGGVCVRQLTTGSCSDSLSSSSSSSAITVDAKNSLFIHNDVSTQGPSTVWTNKKHSLYLDSLEASFVEQLHHSIALRGSLQKILSGSYSSRTLPTNNCNSSQKLMVLQDGSRQNVNSKRNNKPFLGSTADSHFIQEKPCMINFSCSGKRHSMACDDLQNGGLSSKRIHAEQSSPVCCASVESSEQRPAYSQCYHNSVSINLEVSDQNFVDEDQGETCMATVKRLKMVESDAASNDQVVAFGNPNSSKFSTARQASREREEQVNQELLSESPENVLSKIQSSLFLTRELSWKWNNGV